MRLALFAVAALCVSGLAAHADTLTYNLTSSFADGGSVKGTLTLDNTTGLFTAADFTAAGFPISNGTFTVIFDQGPDLVSGYDLDVVPPGYGPELEFDFSPASFVKYNSGAIGVNSFYFNSGIVYDNSFAQSTSVTLQPAVTPPSSAVTPEPSSIALLGTGMLGVAGVVRKRLMS